MEAALLEGRLDAAHAAAIAGALWGPALVLARASNDQKTWTDTCTAMCTALLTGTSASHTALTMLGGGTEGLLRGLGGGAWVPCWWRHVGVVAANRCGGDERVLVGMADMLMRGHNMVCVCVCVCDGVRCCMGFPCMFVAVGWTFGCACVHTDTCMQACTCIHKHIHARKSTHTTGGCCAHMLYACQCCPKHMYPSNHAVHAGCRPHARSSYMCNSACHAAYTSVSVGIDTGYVLLCETGWGCYKGGMSWLCTTLCECNIVRGTWCVYNIVCI